MDNCSQFATWRLSKNTRFRARRRLRPVFGGRYNSSMKLRVGLVGLGDVWQTRHAAALRALADRFEVRAVCDQVRHRAEHAAGEFHAEVVDGYHVLAQREDIDAVLVLSPQWYGALPILAACESGKDVYCAAGLDLEPDEAQRIKRRVEEAGIAFVAEFPRRQAPPRCGLGN